VSIISRKVGKKPDAKRKTTVFKYAGYGSFYFGILLAAYVIFIFTY
jgi:hypothetical protein